MCIKASLKATSYLFFLGAMSCAWDQMNPAVDCSIAPIQVELLERSETDCGTPSGGFTIGVSGGESPYTFSSEAGTSTDGVFQNVGAGSYTVTVTDINGCSDETLVEILNADGVNLDEVKIVDAECGSLVGEIEVKVSGGVAPYSYTLNDFATQQTNTFSGLGSGTHVISVIDKEGCEVTKSVQILSGVSYESTIEKIIKNSCTSCHGVSASPSFDSYEQIKTHAGAIKRVTGNRSMPKESTLSQDEIDRIACWVEDGALEN